MNKTDKLLRALTYALLIGLSVLFIAPFVWLLSTSVKPDAQIFTETPVWIPETVQWKNYSDGLTAIPFLLYLKNTLLICVLSVIGTVWSASLVAYGLSRIRGADVKRCLPFSSAQCCCRLR